MAIIRMISRDVAAFRAFQSRMATVGKIRLGVYNGRYPEKIDTFRFTAENRELIEAVAAAYGGTAEEWKPQGGGSTQWEVITEAKAVPVYLVNGQDIEPWYEAWGSGRTCLRRCDGQWNKQTDEPCLCNGPERPADARQLCKPTIRVTVMLKEVPGLGSWLMESHGENACAEISTLAPLVAKLPMPLPAMLRLRQEKRREWNPDKRKFDTKDFYVPWFDVSVVSAQQVAIGGDALTQALTAAGAPAVLGSDRRAIEAAPVSAVPVSAPAGPTAPTSGEPDWQGGAKVDREEFGRILQAIEDAQTVARLDGIREGMQARKIRAKPIQDAWVSKRAALMQEAAARLDAMAKQDPDGFAAALDALPPGDREEIRRRMAARDDRAVFEQAARDEPDGHPRAEHMGGGRPCLDPWCANGPTPCGFTPNEHMEAHGARAILDADHEARRVPDGGEPGWRVTEFDHAESLVTAAQEVLSPEKAAELAGLVHGADVTVDADGLPVLPPGEYVIDAELPRLMVAAGKLDPPLTTDAVRAMVVAAFGLGHVGEATGEQYARVRLAIEYGMLP